MSADKKSKNFIHVGLPKTGSTFLQKRFFPSLEDITYCYPKTTHKSFFEYFHMSDDFEFNPLHARRLFEQGLESSNAKETWLISDESFCGTPWNGNIVAKRNYDRLADIFIEPHIVIVLRNQIDMLDSLYRHYIKCGGTMSLRKFLTPKVHRKVWSFNILKYGHHVNYLRENFGKNNVTVLFFEDFTKNPVDYFNRWCRVLGLAEYSWPENVLHYKENVGISPLFLGFMKFANKFAGSSKHPSLLLPSSVHTKTKRFVSFISKVLPPKKGTIIPQAELYKLLPGIRESNILLQELVNRDLEELGYQCK